MRVAAVLVASVHALTLAAALVAGCGPAATSAPPSRSPATQSAAPARGDGPACACPAPPTDERCQKMCKAHESLP